MLRRSRRGRTGGRFLIDEDCHPQTIAAMTSRAEPMGIDAEAGDPETADLDGCYGVLVQYPGTTGRIRDLAAVAGRAREAGAQTAVAADPLALCVLTPPGELGADAVVGSMQRFGVPMGFGGPHAAYIAVRSGLERSLPGRLVGVSVDSEGRRALRLALQTREQHIRREKATSNICTSQVLLAIAASMYALYHGPDGLRRIALRVNRLAAILAQGLREAGVGIVHDEFFDTVCARTPGRGRQGGGDGPGRGCEPAPRGRRHHLCHSGRDHNPRGGAQGVESLRGDCRHRPPGRDRRRSAPGAVPPVRVGAVASDLLLVFQRDGADALHAPPRRPRRRPGPVDDPAGLLHHEAQRRHRDGAGELAGAGRCAPLRPAGPDRRLPEGHRPARAVARGDHGFRSGVPAAQQRRPGRAGRPARHTRLPPQPRRRRPRCVPGALIGSRHQRRQRCDGGDARGRGGLRRPRQRRCRRPRAPGLRPPRRAVVRDDHLPLHARRLRVGRPADMRHGAPQRRPGVP